MAHPRSQFPHRLEIMIEHIGPLSKDDVQRRGAARKIRSEDLDGNTGALLSHRANDLGDMVSAPIRQVIPGDHGDHDVLKAEFFDRTGNPHGLICFGSLWRLSEVDVAKAAIASAFFAQGQKGSRLVGIALEPIGAFRLFANRIQPVFGEDRIRLEKIGPFGKVAVQPGGKPSSRGVIGI